MNGRNGLIWTLQNKQLNYNKYFILFIISIFTAYDPCLLAYFIPGVKIIPVFIILALITFSYNPIKHTSSLSSILKRDNILLIILATWSLYFAFHAIILQKTTLEFSLSRIIRIIFFIFLIGNIYNIQYAHKYSKLLIIYGSLVSAYAIAAAIFLSLDFYGTTSLISVPELKVEYLFSPWFGFIWPELYVNHFEIGDFKIYRIFTIFNEPAALSFFLEPLVFYSYYFYTITNKHRYLISCILIICGIISSTSLNGILSIIMTAIAILAIKSKNKLVVLIPLALLIFIAIIITVKIDYSIISTFVYAEQKLKTIDQEILFFQTGMSMLTSGNDIIFGNGYDFVQNTDFVSANVLLSNLQRGGLVGVLFVIMTFIVYIGELKKHLNTESPAVYFACALLPNIFHLLLKAHYEFTFIYLINYAIVYSFINYMEEGNSARAKFVLSKDKNLNSKQYCICHQNVY